MGGTWNTYRKDDTDACAIRINTTYTNPLVTSGIQVAVLWRRTQWN
jgi:hypothetical protein